MPAYFLADTYWTLSAGKGWELRTLTFDGNIEFLLQSGCIVVAETYPAEFYKWFAGDRPRSKMDIASRKRFGSNLFEWAHRSEVSIAPKLRNAIDAGFSEGKDDAFDAVVGLFGILQICLGERMLYEPVDTTVREIEGWILGRRSRHVEQAPIHYSACTDPDLLD